MKCKNCGAELNNGKCEYCGSVFIEDMSFVTIDINIDKEKVLEAIKRKSVLLHSECPIIY